MGKLLRFEFRKLFRMKSFYVCLLIMAVMAFIGAKLTSSMPKEMVKELSYNLQSNYYGLTGGKGNFTLVMLSIIIPIFVCLDFTNGAIKNVVARGYSRTKIFFSKYIVAIFITLVFVLGNMGFNYVAAKVFIKQENAVIPNFWYNILAIIIVSLITTTLGFIIAFIIRKVAGPIGIGILAPDIIALLLGALHLVKGMEKTKIPEYWYSSFYAKITEFGVKSEVLTNHILYSIAYILVFLVLGYFIFRKSEV